MAAFACVLGLAAGLACDPDRATDPLRQVGARANLANPDSVSVVNLCGPRISIRNANDASISVTATYTPLVLPKRPAGEPFSETFFVKGPTEGAAVVSVGSRSITMFRFVDGTSQPIRQAVLDAVDATVLGGVGLGVGKYYIEVPLPLDSGVGPRNAVWNRLRRNSAVKRVVAELGDDVITPGSVTPNDGLAWKMWRLESVDISHAGWHLEMDRPRWPASV